MSNTKFSDDAREIQVNGSDYIDFCATDRQDAERARLYLKSHVDEEPPDPVIVEERPFTCRDGTPCAEILLEIGGLPRSVTVFGAPFGSANPVPENDNRPPRRTKAAEPLLPSTSCGDLIVRRLSDVKLEPIEWLWPGRLARGMQFIVSGRPESGKSTAVHSIIAAVTTGGDWPDGGKAQAGNCIILSMEENASQVLRPRLEAAGADLSRVHIVEGVRAKKGVKGFSVKDDLDKLERAIRSHDAILVVIDPITAYLGNNIDENSNVQVRAVLDPVSKMAERTNATILSIAHDVKGKGYATSLSRISGSLGFGAVARGAFTVQVDKDDSGCRLFLHSKTNIGKRAPSLAFHIEEKEVAEGIVGSYAVWEDEPVDVTAEEAMREAEGGGPSRKQQAIAFLKSCLGSGPAPANEIEARARDEGFTKMTLRRARESLGIKPGKASMTGGWMWKLPDQHDGIAKDGHTPADDRLRGKPEDDGAPSKMIIQTPYNKKMIINCV